MCASSLQTPRAVPHTSISTQNEPSSQGNRTRRRRRRHHRQTPPSSQPQSPVQHILNPANLLRRLLPSSSLFSSGANASWAKKKEITPKLKGTVDLKLKFQPTFFSTLSLEAVFSFCNPQNRSGVSQKARIPPIVEVYSGHALKHKNKQTKETHNMPPYCLCGIFQVSVRHTPKYLL